MRVWVAGHNGMVGQALMRRLKQENCTLIEITRDELDLRRQADVEAFVADKCLDWIFIAAATVGGIQVNSTQSADFLYDNMTIASNILTAARKYNVSKVMMLGASCMYPTSAEQPIREDSLLQGPLEPTNEGYAVAKLAGLKLARFYREQYGCDFITAIPAASYGPGDNLDPAQNHVIPGLIRRFVEARENGDTEFLVWGTGKVFREFLFVDDMANALVFLMQNYSEAGHINVGSGTEVSIRQLAEMIAKVTGFEGEIIADTSKPDGMSRKLLASERILIMGWKPQISLVDGLEVTYRDFLARTNRVV